MQRRPPSPRASGRWLRLCQPVQHRYDEATDNASNNFHRSHLTYALPAFGITSTDPVVACSGAITRDYLTAKDFSTNWLGTALNAGVTSIGWGFGIPLPPAPDVSAGMPPQRSQMRAIVNDPERSPDVVFMTFGGNDIGFADIVTRWAQPGGCTTSGIEIANDADGSCRVAGAAPAMCQTDGERWTDYTLRSIAAREQVLADLYREVLKDINSERARAARGGRTVPLIVLPYPQVLTSTHGDGCSHMNNNERDFGVQVVRALDATIQRAVRTVAQADGAPVYYAGDVVDALLPNHTVCADHEADRWVRPVSYLQAAIGLAGGVRTARSRNSCIRRGTVAPP